MNACSEFDAAAHFKQAGTGATKDGKLQNAPKTLVLKIPQVNRFIGNIMI